MSLLARNGKLSRKGDGLLAASTGSDDERCCCLFKNCCTTGREAQIILASLVDNGADSTCNTGNCPAINNSYLLGLTPHGTLCCVSGSLSLGLICQVGRGYLSHAVRYDLSTAANNFIYVSLGIYNVITVNENYLTWGLTGSTARAAINSLCNGGSENLPFINYYTGTGEQATNLSCTGGPSGTIAAAGYCTAGTAAISFV